MSFKLHKISMVFALVVFIFFYSSTLDFYFFQDDFFEINISKAENFLGYIDFFKFRSDIIAYRPISLQNYFFLSSNIFNLNPIGFRLISFILMFASSILIIKVIHKVTENSKVGILSSIFWITSSIHFMAISWVAAAYNIVGTFFWLLTSYFFLKYLRFKDLKFYSISFLSFLLTIGSFEFSITWPAIFGFYYFLILKKSFVSTMKLFSPFIVVSLIYLILRLIFIKVPQIPEYQISISFETIKTFFWYILWSFNIPEEFKKQITEKILIFNPIFLAEFWFLTAVTFIGMIWVFILTVATPIYTVVKKKLTINLKLLIFFVFWFTVGIFPVLLIPNHAFSMYLTLASIGVYSAISYLLVSSKKTFLIFTVLLIWIASSFNTLEFYQVNSWMVQAQKTSRQFTQELTSYPALPSHSIVLYSLPYVWQRQPLQDQHALRAVLRDNTISIYYNKEDLLEAIKYKESPRVYIFIPQ